MKSLDGAIGTLHLLDDLAAEDTPLTRLAPLAKIGSLFLYLAAFASLGPNHLAGACLLLLPLPVLYQVGKIPWKPALRQCLPVLLLLAGVGAVNLFLPRVLLLPWGLSVFLQGLQPFCCFCSRAWAVCCPAGCCWLPPVWNGWPAPSRNCPCPRY